MDDATYTPEAKHILFVDDEDEVRSVLLRLLEQQMPDVHASACEDGASALLHLETHRVDAIVSDQRMPGMDGVTLLAEARRRHPSTARVLLTGYGDVDVAKRAVNEGHIAAFLTKPIAGLELISTLRTILDEDTMRHHRERAVARAFATLQPIARPRTAKEDRP